MTEDLADFMGFILRELKESQARVNAPEGAGAVEGSGAPALLFERVELSLPIHLRTPSPSAPGPLRLGVELPSARSAGPSRAGRLTLVIEPVKD